MSAFDPTLPPGWDISASLRARLRFADGSAVEVGTDGTWALLGAAGEEVAAGGEFCPSPCSGGWADVLEDFLGFLTVEGEDAERLWGEDGAAWADARRMDLECEMCALQPED